MTSSSLLERRLTGKVRSRAFTPLDLVHLTPVLEASRGRPEVVIGLIDGPVAVDHPQLATNHLRVLPGRLAGTCTSSSSAACTHGTFVAGILSGKRGSASPAICPDATLLIRPIFGEGASTAEQVPRSTPRELAEAVVETVEAGAHVLNLSVALDQPFSRHERELEDALNYAARRGVIIVAAAGNQGTLGGTVITRHSWVIPVVAFDPHGRPLSYSNLGSSIGRRGLGAPGSDITSLSAKGTPVTLSGTSIAAPFVTGAIAVLWSDFPAATATEVKTAVTQGRLRRRTQVVPPLLNAWAAHRALNKSGYRRKERLGEQAWP